jgi:uncharacterized protein
MRAESFADLEGESETPSSVPPAARLPRHYRKRLEKAVAGKNVLIIGGSSGIGATAAVDFAAVGGRVAIAARREAALREVRSTIETGGGECMYVVTDVTDPGDVRAMASRVLDQFGHIDVCVSCVGRYYQKNLVDIDIVNLRESMEVNFYGVVRCVRAILPDMVKRSSGRIVIVNTFDSIKGIVGDGPYVVAKSALRGYAEVLRQELRAKRIGVSSVFPGRVDTPMVSHLRVPWISPKINPRRVVAVIAKAVTSRPREIVVPGIYYFLSVLNVLSPRSLDWLYRTFRLQGTVVADKADE